MTEYGKSIVQKWAPMLEGINTDDMVCVIANLLENTNAHIEACGFSEKKKGKIKREVVPGVRRYMTDLDSRYLFRPLQMIDDGDLETMKYEYLGIGEEKDITGNCIEEMFKINLKLDDFIGDINRRIQKYFVDKIKYEKTEVFNKFSYDDSLVIDVGDVIVDHLRHSTGKYAVQLTRENAYISAPAKIIQLLSKHFCYSYTPTEHKEELFGTYYGGTFDGVALYRDDALSEIRVGTKLAYLFNPHTLVYRSNTEYDLHMNVIRLKHTEDYFRSISFKK